MNRNNEGISAVPACGYTDGSMPGCAPLANVYVPFQQEGVTQYDADCALIKGTLFPGLNLPFMGMENTEKKNGSQKNLLQALHFAVTELGLYLDTHPDDSEAVEVFNQYAEQYQDALQQYQQSGGVLTQMESAMSGQYAWVKDPWPWELAANKEG